jgi:nucleoid DNA-binding protein
MRRCKAPAAPLVLTHQHQRTHPHGKTLETMHHFTREVEAMNQAQTVGEISRRLPRLKRRDVAEVLAVMHELWLEALANGDEVTVGDLGKLVVQHQKFVGGGSVRQCGIRVYVRFRPTKRVRQAIREGQKQ